MMESEGGGRMDKKKIIIISVVTLVIVAICFGVLYFSKQDLEKAQNDLNQTIEKFGVVEKETVATTIAKFNTEIVDGGLNTPATEDSMVMENGLYWYALTEELSCYAKPIEFTENKDQDITELIVLYCDKEGYNEETATKYASKLLKANQPELTEQEITNLIEDAKAHSAEQTAANNGKGVSLGFLETENHYEYQVRRLYK